VLLEQLLQLSGLDTLSMRRRNYYLDSAGSQRQPTFWRP